MHPSSRGRGPVSLTGMAEGRWRRQITPFTGTRPQPAGTETALDGCQEPVEGRLKALGQQPCGLPLSHTQSSLCVCVSQGEYRGHLAARAAAGRRAWCPNLPLRPACTLCLRWGSLGNSAVKTGGSFRPLWTHTPFFSVYPGEQVARMGGNSPHPPWSGIAPTLPFVTPPPELKSQDGNLSPAGLLVLSDSS